MIAAIQLGTGYGYDTSTVLRKIRNRSLPEASAICFVVALNRSYITLSGQGRDPAAQLERKQPRRKSARRRVRNNRSTNSPACVVSSPAAPGTSVFRRARTRAAKQ